MNPIRKRTWIKMKNTLLPRSGSSQSHCWKKTCRWQPIIRASRKSSRGRLTKMLLAGKDGQGPVIYKGRRPTWKSPTLPHKPFASRWCSKKQRRKESWWIPDSLWLRRGHLPVPSGDLWSFFDLLLITHTPNSGAFPEHKHAMLLNDPGGYCPVLGHAKASLQL